MLHLKCFRAEDDEMKNRFSIIILFLASFAFTATAISQQGGGYNPHEIFRSELRQQRRKCLSQCERCTRTTILAERADYKIAATLDTTMKTITGKVEITYTNNSPEELRYIWLQLEQNQLGESSRGSLVAGNPARNFIGGDNIKSVVVEQSGKTFKADYIINDTRMQIRLPFAD